MKNLLANTILVALVLFGATLTFAQADTKAEPKPEKKIIAISNFYNAVIGNEEPQVGRQLIALFANEFTKDGTYQVVADQELKQILATQDKSLDERMDPATAAKIGKIASANVYVFGNITEFTLTKGGFDAGTTAEKTSFTAKLGLIINLIDVNTGLTIKSVNVDGTAVRSATKIIGIGKKLEMSDDLRKKLFTEAARDAVKKAVNELSDAIKNSNSLAVATKENPSVTTPSTSAVKNLTPESTRTMSSPAASSNSSAKIVRVLGNVVLLSDLVDVKVGDFFSIVRGNDNKEIALIEITEVSERSAKAKILQGTGIQPSDRLKRQ